MFCAEEVLAAPFRMVGVILDTGASNVLSPFHAQTLTEALAAQAATRLQGSRHRSQRFRERTFSFIPPLFCRCSGGLVFSFSLRDPLAPSSTLSDTDGG